MDQTLAELNQKLDRLAAQVSYLTEQAQAAERQRQERAELMRDVMPIINDAFRLTTEQLEEVQHYADLDDLLCVLKHLLRNTRNLGMMLEQLESLMDLLQTVGPLSDHAFGVAVDKLAEAERKGYFAFARGSLQIVDNIVTSFSEEDVRALGDNIVLILNVIKELTQPQIMSFVKHTVAAAEEEIAKPVDISLRALLRQMNDPAVRRGLALTMRVLRVIGAQAA
jgi:uncharacterized protein YjgD (DUF1641 family)